MNLRARLIDAARTLGLDRSQGREPCSADWRRPGGYWRCARTAGHEGRHRMRPAARSSAPATAAADRSRAGNGDGGVAAG